MLSSNRVPVVILPPCGIMVRDPELMPQTLVICDLKFCHLRHPVVSKVQGCSVVSNKGRKLQESVGEREGHRSVAIDQSIAWDGITPDA